MTKKTLTAIGLSLLFGSGAALATDPVLIDFDGTGGLNTFQEVGTLDWLVGSSLSEGAIDGTATYTDGTTTYSAGEILLNPDLYGEALTCVTGCTFSLYSHAELSTASDTDAGGIGINGLNSAFEWTFILGGSEDVTNQTVTQAQNGTVDVDGTTYNLFEVGSTLNFSGTSQTNADGWFYEIYYDTSPDADALSGLGYDDGSIADGSDGGPILESFQLETIDGNFTSVLFSYADVDGSGDYTIGDIVIADSTSSGFIFSLMDAFNDNDWNDGSAADGAECDTNANAGTDGECWSVEGRGSTTLEASVDPADVDPDFITATSNFLLISDLFFSTQNVLPFLQTQPSACYDTVAGGATNDCNHVFGDLVAEDGSITGNVVNGSGSSANCQFALDPIACFAAVSIGEDIIFQTDANTTFGVREVPEPGTLALLGLGFGFLGARRWRQGRTRA